MSRLHRTNQRIFLPRRVQRAAGTLALVLVTAVSAVVAKELSARSVSSALAAVAPAATPISSKTPLLIVDPLSDSGALDADLLWNPPAPQVPLFLASPVDLKVRWFNGRAVRPARTITMTVTAYSPDEQSCAGSADNITASLHHVATNNYRMVAADSRVLPLGSMISVPGYESGQIVPVLDRGGKIKGKRLDLLYPTHKEALAWGVKKLKVTVWEYADGQPADNWRAIRDAKTLTARRRN